MNPQPASAELAELLTPVLPQAYRAALQMAHREDEAEDVVQEASLHAWRAFHTFRPGSNFRAWFFTILTNCFRARRRKEKRERAVAELLAISGDPAAGSNPLAPWAPPGDPADAALLRIESQQALEAIASLPDEFRIVAALYFLEQFRYDEIAEVIDRPKGTVRSRLHRARRLIRDFLVRPPEPTGAEEVVRAAAITASRAIERAECEAAFRLFDDYVDGELSSAEAKRVEEHLAICELCSREYGFLRILCDRVRAKLQALAVPPELGERIAAVLERRRRAGPAAGAVQSENP